MLKLTLDWLAFTFKEDTFEAGTWIRLYASDKTNVPETARNGYTEAYRTKTGVVVQWNSYREEMGYHVVIAGTAIRHVLQHYELDQKALVQTVIDAGGSITRLDIAKDLTGINVSLDEIYQAMEHREYSGTARKFAQIHSLAGGNTIYVGSRQSEKFLRIYDKAAESGLQGELWKRLELETKGMVARALANLLVQTEDWQAAMDSMVKHMVHLPNTAAWQAFFTQGLLEIGIPKLEKKTDREKWIEIQVIPAVVKHAAEFPDSRAVALLIRMLAFVENR